MSLFLTVLAGVAALTALAARSPGILQSSSFIGASAVLLVAGTVASLRRGTRLRIGPALLCIGFFLVYEANGILSSSGDNLGVRALPAALVLGHGFDVARIPPFAEDKRHYSVVRLGSTLVPSYPIGTSLLALPSYVIFSFTSYAPLLPSRLDEAEKLAAGALATLSSCLLFLGLRPRFGSRAALFGTLVFALATPVTSTASQGLWSATGAIFLLCAGLSVLMQKNPRASNLVGAGLLFGFSFLCRPTAILPAIFFLVLLPGSARRRRLVLTTSGLAAGVLISCTLNALLVGSPFGPWSALIFGARERTHDLVAGALGSLLSPSRGLLVWCPWIILVAPAAFSASRGSRTRQICTAALLAVAPVWLLIAANRRWWGGYATGPRLFLEAAPFLAIAASASFVRPAGRVRKAIGIVLTVLIVTSSVTHLLATIRPEARNWNETVDVDANPNVLWSWRDSQLAAAWFPRWKLSEARAQLHLVDGYRRDDRLTGSVDGPVETQTVHGRLVARGWARTSSEDLDVLIQIEGDPPLLPVQVRRFARPDVCAVLPDLGSCGQAGWEADFGVPTTDRTGEVQLSALFRSKDGRYRRYPAVSFVWKR